jgi:hypothetical protein
MLLALLLQLPWCVPCVVTIFCCMQHEQRRRQVRQLLMHKLVSMQCTWDDWKGDAHACWLSTVQPDNLLKQLLGPLLS